MTERLIHLLWRNDCTVQDVRTFLNSQPDIQSVINPGDYGGCHPLRVAVLQRKNSDILLELIKNGADVNQKWCLKSILMEVFNWIIDKNFKYPYFDVIKLFLENGADVNGQKFTSPLINFLTNPQFSGSEFYVPITQMMLRKADESTKNLALHILIKHILQHQSEAEARHFIQAVKLLLESGISLAIDNMLCYNTLLQRYFDCHAENKSHYVVDLFKIILPHYMKQISYNIIFRLRERYNSIVDNLKSKIADSDARSADILAFPDLLKTVWDNCVEEWDKMRCDTLPNNRSLLQVLQDSCGTESEKASVTNDDFYEVFKRYARDDYPHFKDIMSYTIKNSNMMGLHNLISREYLGNIYVIHPDFFCNIAKHLSKDDILNFLLALLPRKCTYVMEKKYVISV